MRVITRVGPDERVSLVAALSTFHYCDEMPKVIVLERRKFSWVWWCTPLVPALGTLRKEGLCEVEASLGYSVRPCFKKDKEGRKEGEKEEEGSV